MRVPGSNNFRIITEETKGNVLINEDTQFNNIDADTVVIEEGVTARLFGKINTLLVLKKGSRLYMLGAIYGKIENCDGYLHVFGN